MPGTTENVVKPLLEKHSNKHCGSDFGLSINPEFLREGSALQDTLNPDRIIIGEYDRKSGDTIEALYRDFYGDKTPPQLEPTSQQPHPPGGGKIPQTIKKTANNLTQQKVNLKLSKNQTN